MWKKVIFRSHSTKLFRWFHHVSNKCLWPPWWLMVLLCCELCGQNLWGYAAIILWCFSTIPLHSSCRWLQIPWAIHMATALSTLKLKRCKLTKTALKRTVSYQSLCQVFGDLLVFFLFWFWHVLIHFYHWGIRNLEYRHDFQNKLRTDSGWLRFQCVPIQRACQAARDAIVKLNNMEISGKRIQAG